MIVIDGTNLIVGRAATVIAKKALLGETIKVINCEKMFVTGDKVFLQNDVQRRRDQGTWEKGPFFFRRSDKFVRRIIRGMIPYKTPRGSAAYKRVMCYVGIPPEYKDQKAITIETAHIKKVKNLKYMTVGQLSKHMGSKVE